jgi:hypothetical protein
MRYIKYAIFILLIQVSLILSQNRPYEGPEDPAGDLSNLREAYMNGNRVLLYFQNFGRCADWWGKGVDDSRWPNTYEGVRMIDHAHLAIMSRVYVRQDSIPIESEAELESYQGQGEKIDTLFYIQSYGSSGDVNYEATVGWGFYPVKGYFNESQDYIAMSNKDNSWPPDGWPSTGFSKKWPGEWNGRFGRGIKYADLESYYVFNDAQDLEYIVVRNDPEGGLIKDGPRYYPRPGLHIGDIDPTVTVQKGYPWGGLGLRISTRGFQWNNPEARDMIFWEFDIANVSDYTLPTSGFAIVTDLSVGDEHGGDDDTGYFDTYLDMAYAWDWDGIGVGGRVPGTFGMAFLESPGVAYDGTDNDMDGLVDELRDNQAGSIVGPYDGITNLPAFLEFYNKKEEDLRDHFEGDEDQDWQDGTDLNGDGDYSYFDEITQTWLPDPGEISGDDVGLDGVGPTDLNYTGPDEGECNHKPDFKEGEGCEPNFAATDVSESDMLGLTTFRLSSYSEREANFWYPASDKEFYLYLDSHVFDEYTGTTPQPIDFLFSSSTFPLYAGRTERISVAMLHAYEDLSTLTAAGHKAPNLYKQKEIAQIIYEADYRFAQPPKMPTLTATAGDGKVILSWDNVADQLTREPFLGNINDFEGYKVYRATDKLFSDAEIVTNSQGVKMFKKPIFQCDLIDSISGHANYGVVGGAEFYLGDDTGINHYFVDEQVQNGKTYYYAIVAYDYGAPQIGNGIAPAENNIVMELDEAEEIIRMGDNVAVVVPRKSAAGYENPSLTVSNSQMLGNGTITPTIFDRNSIKPNHTYKVKFDVDTIGHMVRVERDRHPMDLVRVNNGIKVYDVTAGNELVYEETPDYFPLENIIERNDRNINYLMSQTAPIQTKFYRSDQILTDNFDGIQLIMEGLNGYLPAQAYTTIPETGINQENTGWITGDANINTTVSNYDYYGFPYTYDIVFTDNSSAFVNRLNRTTGIRNLDGGSGNFIFNQSFSFYVLNQTANALTGVADTMEMVVDDINLNGTFDILEDRIIVGPAVVRAIGSNYLISWGSTVFGFDFMNVEDVSKLPKPGDIYRLDFNKPFFESDSIIFTIDDLIEVDENKLNDSMDDIKVVPNPYIMTNSMEPSVRNKFLNQRRRIMFTNIPAQCEIMIFTTSGVLVDKIEVENEPSDGAVHWDLLTKEDLEIAAGMYVYYVKSKRTGKEKTGLFAIIK